MLIFRWVAYIPRWSCICLISIFSCSFTSFSTLFKSILENYRNGAVFLILLLISFSKLLRALKTKNYPTNHHSNGTGITHTKIKQSLFVFSKQSSADQTLSFGLEFFTETLKIICEPELTNVWLISAVRQHAATGFWNNSQCGPSNVSNLMKKLSV